MTPGLVEGPIGLAFAALWGALWGSFFNVVIFRVPAGESIVTPPSHCRRCGRQVPWYDNIPVLSYVLLRGRCRGCGVRFSPRYALVELLIAAIAAGLYVRYVVGVDVELWLRMVRFLTVSVFAGLLVAIAFIDLDTLRIPNVITYPAIPTCAALSLLMGHAHPWEGLVGAVVGYVVIRVIADGYELLTGRQGMGYGDAKLLAMIGGLLGWRVLLPTIFLASFQGSVIGIGALVILRRRQARGEEADAASAPGLGDGAEEQASGEGEEGSGSKEAASEEDEGEEEEVEDGQLRYARIPFGPFLSLAAIEIMLWGEALMRFFPYLQG